MQFREMSFFHKREVDGDFHDIEETFQRIQTRFQARMGIVMYINKIHDKMSLESTRIDGQQTIRRFVPNNRFTEYSKTSSCL